MLVSSRVTARPASATTSMSVVPSIVHLKVRRGNPLRNRMTPVLNHHTNSV